MIRSDALEVLVGLTRPDDFYKPLHGHIAAAMARIYEKGASSGSTSPADPVTIANELAKNGLLDVKDDDGRDIDVKRTLLALMSTAPATSNARRYAGIIREKATLRRLIGAAAEIAELGYGVPNDVSAAVLRAHELVRSISVTRDAVPFGDVAAVLDGHDEPETPSMLLRSDGRGLLYVARMNTLQGDPGSGKTWIADMTARQVLEAGGAVLFLDYEDTLRSAVTRLRLLGTPLDAIRERFLYVRPDETVENAAIVAIARTMNVDLVVIDAVAEALSVRGYSEDSAAEFIAWVEELPRPLTRGGATVLMLDHVVKSKEERGRWARGSGAKLGASDGATFTVSATEPFNQRRAGRIKLTVAKDRHGGLDQPTGKPAASVWIDPTAGPVIRYTIDPPLPEPDEPVDPEEANDRLEDAVRSELAERVVQALDDAGEPLSRRGLLAALRAGKDRLKFRDALLEPVLVDLKNDGRIEKRIGRRGHDVYAAPPRQPTLDEHSGDHS